MAAMKDSQTHIMLKFSNSISPTFKLLTKSGCREAGEERRGERGFIQIMHLINYRLGNKLFDKSFSLPNLMFYPFYLNVLIFSLIFHIYVKVNNR